MSDSGQATVQAGIFFYQSTYFLRFFLCHNFQQWTLVIITAKRAGLVITTDDEPVCICVFVFVFWNLFIFLLLFVYLYLCVQQQWTLVIITVKRALVWSL